METRSRSFGERNTPPPHATARMSAPGPEIAGQIDHLAAQLHSIDDVSSRRLHELAIALTTESGRLRWSDVDLRRAFNTDRLSHSWAVRKEGGYAPRIVDIADKIRNVLVLVPVLLTWFALAGAASSYQKYVDTHPENAATPFLILWQRGFDDTSPWYEPGFSTVALIDAAIIACIVMLTLYTHGRRERQEDKIADSALLFQADLDNALSEAGVLLATDRSSRPVQLADSVERLADSFETSSSSLLNQLQVEHDRLDSLAGRREKEFADFGVFASGMRAGAEEMHRLLVDLRDVSSGLERALEDLASDVSRTGDQQRSLLSAVSSLEKLTSSSIQADQAVSRQLAQAASRLSDTADKTISGAESAAQAGRVALDAVRGMGEVMERLDGALTNQGMAHSALAETIRTSASGSDATLRQLADIGNGLSRLREDFERISKQNAQHVQSLNQTLAQQAETAREMGSMARELTTANLNGSQQQRTVNQEMQHLIQRLDSMAASLGRLAGESPASRSDVRQETESGANRWTRTRS